MIFFIFFNKYVKIILVIKILFLPNMEKIYLDNLSKDDDKTKIVDSLLDGDSLNVEFYYKSDFTLTKDLRDFIEIIWRVFWFSEKLIARIILVSDELNNNAIEHGSDVNGINILRLMIKRNGQKVDFNLEVEDNWKWKDAKKAIDMEELRAHKLKRWYSKHDSIRWRWLFLITVQIVDRLYFKNSKNWWLIVWVKKEIYPKTDQF